MKFKVIAKAVLRGIELAATLWAVGVFVGAGLRDGAKISDTHDQWFYDIIKARKIKGLQKKIKKLSKKEQLTEDEKKQQEELLHEMMEWCTFDTREAATLGTHEVSGFNIYHKEEKE